MSRKWIQGIAGVAALALAGCGRGQHGASPGAEAPAVPVTILVVARESSPEPILASGTVRAVATASLASRIPGTVRAVHVRAGDRVPKGALLIRLAAQETQSAASAADSSLASADGTVLEAEEALRAAEAQAALASTTLERLRTLHERRAVSRQELDEAEARATAATAARDAARARLASAAAARTGAAALKEGAGAAAGYLRIEAPFAGRVIERLVDPGSIALPGVPLLVLADESAFDVEAALDESRRRAVIVGTRASVTIGERTYEGTTIEVDPGVDPGTRTFRVKVRSALDPAELRPGLFARVAFAGEAAERLAVPRSSLRASGGLDLVYTVADGHARALLVTLGRGGGDRVEVLSGLEPGDRIVLDPPPSLVDGSPVAERP